jgi:RNA polymerase sigma factor (TIGR02999 family)
MSIRRYPVSRIGREDPSPKPARRPDASGRGKARRTATAEQAAARKVSASDMLPLVYGELRALAARKLRSERPNHTLRPTDLVHEVFLKLQAKSDAIYLDRTHFLATASRAMRQVLVDHARAKRAQKRGGTKKQVSLSGASIVFVEERAQDVLAVDRSLKRLAQYDPRLAQIVEMRFFGGLKELEIAAELDCSERWVRKQWEFARAWLLRELEGV